MDEKIEIVSFPSKLVRIKCKKHGWIGTKPAYDSFLKKMTAISCKKCPSILSPNNATNHKD